MLHSVLYGCRLEWSNSTGSPTVSFRTRPHQLCQFCCEGTDLLQAMARGRVPRAEHPCLWPSPIPLENCPYSLLFSPPSPHAPQLRSPSSSHRLAVGPPPEDEHISRECLLQASLGLGLGVGLRGRQGSILKSVCLPQIGMTPGCLRGDETQVHLSRPWNS